MLPEKDKRIEKVVELSKEALDAFCDDIATMFEVDMTCQEQEIVVTDLQSVKKHFSGIAAVHTVNAEGALTGDFQLVFDKGGLFTLAGVIVMLPAKRIQDEVEFGTLEEAQSMGDIVGEVGNLLVGTWDRVFREGMEGHKHFRKASSFIGDPWSDPSKIAGWTDSEKYHFILCEIAIESFACFQCAVLLPLGTKAPAEDLDIAANPDTSPTDPEQEDEITDEDAVLEQELVREPAPRLESKSDSVLEAVGTKDGAETTPVEEVASEPEPAPITAEDIGFAMEAPEASEDDAEDLEEPDVADRKPASITAEDIGFAMEAPGESAETAPDTEEQEPLKPEPASAAAEEDPAVAGQQERPETAADIEALHASSKRTRLTETSYPAEEGDEPIHIAPPEIVSITSPVSTKARQGEGLAKLMSLTARDLMGSKVVWVSPSASVHEVLTAMQQHDVGYVVAGENGILEGLVSKSNVLGALSPYLRPVFAKWRRPADDATMNIKVQWIMSRPVRTVRPEASLAVIVEQMRQFGGRCLPVVAADGSVEGLVTVFDILRVLTPDLDTCLVGQTPQAPCLMV
jgi:CBS domain-containing protein